MKAKNGKLNTVEIEINKLKPAEYNPRVELKPTDDEYIKIKNSIEQLGYCDPVVVNKDFTVIGGHQRLNVLKDLGYKSITVVKVNVSKEKEKTLNVALNKITGKWDKRKLADLFDDLSLNDFDIEITGFDAPEIDKIMGIDDFSVNARINTVNAYNLDIFNEQEVDGFYQMPMLHDDKVIPTDLIGFNYAMTSKNKETGIHFFIDDYQFERLWNDPQRYLDILKNYEVILTPDFSLYMNMPMAMKVWNVYRSRLLGQYWQSNGIKVIPTISWAEEETFSFCFDGVPKGSTVAISTMGVKRDLKAKEVWNAGMDAMIEKIKPKTIICYGGEVDYDFGKTKVIYFDNKVTDKFRKEKGV
ncbi:DUF4417 domain-containing protein [Anaerorhabdus sp.]|uniref:DUF4417 domain-containing protein n=1 Tax=Anaerorhabdus sp. TaxID=1872524 RepID=UPI002FC9AE38